MGDLRGSPTHLEPQGDLCLRQVLQHLAICKLLFSRLFSPPSWHMGVRARITNSCFHDKKLCIHTPAMRLLSFFAHNRFRLLVPFFSLFLLFFLHPGVRYPGTHEQHVRGGEGFGGELLLVVILPSTWSSLFLWVVLAVVLGPPPLADGTDGTGTMY